MACRRAVGATATHRNSGGVQPLNFQDELERDRRRKPDNETADHAEPRSPRKGKGQTGEVGDALRTVYQRTIEEDIPPEMLDLLGKLG